MRMESKAVIVRLEAEVHRRLKVMAAVVGKSLSEMVGALMDAKEGPEIVASRAVTKRESKAGVERSVYAEEFCPDCGAMPRTMHTGQCPTQRG